MYSLGILTISAFFLSLVLTPFLRNWSVRVGLTDKPDQKRKFHAAPIPRTGGIPILLSYLGAYVILLLLPVQSSNLIADNFSNFLRLLPPVALLFATGLLDDWISLKPWQKLLGQLIASVWAWFSGVRIESVAGHDTTPWISLALTVAWLILCSNAFNLIDGVDGLATGVGLTATLTTLVAGVLRGDIALGLATAPLAGALLGFLRYNFNPASIFLGDCGSLLIGFLLGAYSVIWSQKSATMLGVAAPVLALGLPLLEVGLSIVRRFLRNEPIFSPDRGHIHHRLLERGFTPRRVALLLYAACGVGAILSLIQSLLHNEFAAIAILLFGGVTLVGVRYLGYAEFAATSRFLWVRLRPMLGAHVKLELLERSLTAADSVQDCWRAMETTAKALGYSEMTARLGESRFYTGSAAANRTEHVRPYWQMRLNLSKDCWVNISQQEGGTEQPLLVMPFAEIVGRILPGKLAQLNSGAATLQPMPRNSKTTTVISSDCAVPSVNAATAF
jgi:UDP-GlcNAc:undecaprenyl-phosphate/decaprenyl-phosphate GlcNAc-1-phosphate transferase